VKKYLIPFGFTLIELMITIVIVVLLSGGALAAYLNFNKSQTMQNDARRVLSELNRIRTMATSQQYPVGCTSLKGVKVEGVAEGTELTVTTQCGSGNYAGGVIEVLTSSNFSSAVDITYLPGSGYISDGAGKEIVIHDDVSPTVTKTISVEANGLASIL
jgi:prepilin-type N-terminal cleavage/methylation domain-containing protein